jgi:hypothetical protein
MPQMLSSVEHVSVKVFNRDASIFSESAAMRRYADKAQSGLAGLGLSENDNGLMAAIILFSAPSVAGNSNADQVRHIVFFYGDQ